MIAVVDYGVGNLYSLTCSLRHIGAQCTVTREENALRAADRIILPGVGAFGDAAEKLHALRLDALLCDLALGHVRKEVHVVTRSTARFAHR